MSLSYIKLNSQHTCGSRSISVENPKVPSWLCAFEISGMRHKKRHAMATNLSYTDKRAHKMCRERDWFRWFEVNRLVEESTTHLRCCCIRELQDIFFGRILAPPCRWRRWSPLSKPLKTNVVSCWNDMQTQYINQMIPKSAPRIIGKRKEWSLFFFLLLKFSFSSENG